MVAVAMGLLAYGLLFVVNSCVQPKAWGTSLGQASDRQLFKCFFPSEYKDWKKQQRKGSQLQ